jgi:hypothetical protein
VITAGKQIASPVATALLHNTTKDNANGDPRREAKLLKFEEEQKRERRESKREGEERKSWTRKRCFYEKASSGGNGLGRERFEFRPGPRQIPLIVYVVFLSPSRQIPEEFLQIGHRLLIPYLTNSSFNIISHPFIQGYAV